jgi:hypothetical protein
MKCAFESNVRALAELRALGTQRGLSFALEPLSASGA